MDRIKFDFSFFFDADYEDCYKSNITIIVNESNDIAKLISKEKRVLSYREIGFVSSFSMEPEFLLAHILEDTQFMLLMNVVGKQGYFIFKFLSIFETQNNIIWTEIENPSFYKFPLTLGFPVDDDFPKQIPKFHFEFEKMQYYQAISDFVDNIFDNANCNLETVIPYLDLNIIEAKKVNNKRLNEILYEEKCFPLEDFLRYKRKNDRKYLKSVDWNLIY